MSSIVLLSFLSQFLDFSTLFVGGAGKYSSCLSFFFLFFLFLSFLAYLISSGDMEKHWILNYSFGHVWIYFNAWYMNVKRA